MVVVRSALVKKRVVVVFLETWRLQRMQWDLDLILVMILVMILVLDSQGA
jgi:hypothetical protein